MGATATTCMGGLADRRLVALGDPIRTALVFGWRFEGVAVKQVEFGHQEFSGEQVALVGAGVYHYSEKEGEFRPLGLEVSRHYRFRYPACEM